jgi:hypothetical protein
VLSAATVLAQRRGIRNLVAQSQTQEPAVGHVHLHLPHQLTLRTHTVQIAQKQQLEQHHRIKRRAAVVFAVEVLHPLPDETEIHRTIDLAQQVLLRHKRLDRYQLKLLLLQLRLLQHVYKIQKTPVENESLSWYLCQQSESREVPCSQTADKLILPTETFPRRLKPC